MFHTLSEEVYVESRSDDHAAPAAPRGSFATPSREPAACGDSGELPMTVLYLESPPQVQRTVRPSIRPEAAAAAERLRRARRDLDRFLGRIGVSRVRTTDDAPSNGPTELARRAAL